MQNNNKQNDKIELNGENLEGVKNFTRQPLEEPRRVGRAEAILECLVNSH